MIGHFEPFAGASGDMILGSLLDAGLSQPRLSEALRDLPLPAWRIVAEPVRRGTLGATLARVICEERDPPARHLAEVLRIVDAAGLPGPAPRQARAIFVALAESEARVHRTAVEEVHFHEVGAADAIIDICATVAGLALLDVDRVICGPLPFNGGSVESAHGRLPLPAPATLELLARVHAPTVPHPARQELLTPTGAAILTTLARFEPAPMSVKAVGYGAGSRLEPVPNVLRLTLGQAVESAPLGLVEEPLVLLECNLDDMNPQLYGHLFELILERGALDVTSTPVLMKKGRPGQVLAILCRPPDAAGLTSLLLSETTTLGVRHHGVVRLAAGRAMATVETPFGPLPVKLRIVEDRVTQATPEYDACRALALRLGLPLARITQAAQAAAQPLLDLPPPPA